MMTRSLLVASATLAMATLNAWANMPMLFCIASGAVIGWFGMGWIMEARN